MSIPTTDRNGFKIDPTVGYARGPILKSPLEEAKKRLFAMQLIRKRVETQGPDSFFNITGLHRDFPLPANKLDYASDWVGPAYYSDEMADLARQHFGGEPDHEVLVLNRCSAGIVASCLALIKPGSKAISLVPGERGHPSIAHGICLAGGQREQVNRYEDVARLIDGGGVSLMMITGVSSELEIINLNILLDSISLANKAGVPVMLDDAYGTRLRPIIYGQPATMRTGVNLAVTACDKAGMGGPRAGLMVGEKPYMDLVCTKAAELGLEARSAIAAAVWWSLKNFSPKELREEVEFGALIHGRLVQKYGDNRIVKSGIGASLTAEDTYDLVKEIRESGAELPVCPAEITSAISMYWLRRYGIISIGALGFPGASIWLRFKPDPKVITRIGGVGTLVDVIDDGIRQVALKADSIKAMRELILGTHAN